MVFKLSEFQEEAIAGIKADKHVLITAHTGSGKTLPAEHAITHFVETKQKRVIYTAPIKALSNQKFSEFQQKFPTISFGILTGDIKFNPEADVLIMTTEILRNTLYLKKQTTTASLEFEMDFERELGCVIFDEVHYVNDASRGHIWEETLLLLPKSCLYVMLSATIDNPKRFCDWVQTNTHRDVVLTGTTERVVPLKHYMFYVTPETFKATDEIKSLTNAVTDKLLEVKTTQYDSTHLTSLLKLNSYLTKNKVRVSNKFVLNKIVGNLKQENKLPAICFVFSRKNCEYYAAGIETCLFSEEDAILDNTIDTECRNVIAKLPNYKEYLELPEYINCVKLLKKGIAYHHSGVAPIIREMIETVFAKGYIKLLFATETFAVGINMPTRTVIFTDISKYDGNSMRFLLSHEYTQMAGRAGRRGLDTVGHVIHCMNMYQVIPSDTEMRTLLNGKPQRLTSKFKIHYNMLLNTLNTGYSVTDIVDYIKSSMTNLELFDEEQQLNDEISRIQDVITKQQYHCFTSGYDTVKHYADLLEQVKMATNKKRKQIERELKTMETKTLTKDVEIYKGFVKEREQLDELYTRLMNVEQYVLSQTKSTLNILTEKEFIVKNETDMYTLTDKGQIAITVQEMHSLVFADVFKQTNGMKQLNAVEVIQFLSCFTNVTVIEKHKTFLSETTISDGLLDLVKQTEHLYNCYYDIETKYGIESGCEYVLHYDMIEYIKEWCESETEQQSRVVFFKMENEKGIFLGEFIKAVLKIVTFVNEIRNLSKQLNYLDTYEKLQDVENLLLKFVVTNQSLYLN